MKTEIVAQIEQLLQKGERWNTIAQTLHVSKTTILKVSRRMSEAGTSIISASEVFTMFEADKSPAYIVKKYNADPVRIREWFDAWLVMNQKWEALQRAKESMAKAQEKGGEEAEKVEKKPPFVRDSKDWEKFLEREGGT